MSKNTRCSRIHHGELEEYSKQRRAKPALSLDHYNLDEVQLLLEFKQPSCQPTENSDNADAK
eukprot:IDg11298t1